MIAPYKWLCDYIDMNLGPEALSQKLIATGTAVEGYTELGLDIQKVVAGKIIKLEKHPDADKLSVCDVDVGEETLQIVCGANNIFEGALVPVALIGANLPGFLGAAVVKRKALQRLEEVLQQLQVGLDSPAVARAIEQLRLDDAAQADLFW